MSFTIDDDTRERLKKMTPKEKAQFEQDMINDFVTILQKASDEKQSIIDS